MPSKTWNEITYPLQNLNGCPVEVWKWISNFIPHLIMDVITITYPCLDWIYSILAKVAAEPQWIDSNWWQLCPGPRFNIKIPSYQYRKSHCGDKTILRPSYLHNGISYTGKMTSLYWIRAQTTYWHRKVRWSVKWWPVHILNPNSAITTSAEIVAQLRP